MALDYCYRIYRQTQTEYILFGFLCVSIVGVLLEFLNHKQRARINIYNSPIQSAFESIEQILVAIVCTMSVTIPIALELALDIILCWKHGVDDRRERLLMISIIVIPGIIILLFLDSPDLPYIFCSLHSVQYVGCLGAILSLCNKLVPKQFPKHKVVFVHFFFSISSILSAIGFGFPLSNWANISVFISLPISLGSFSLIVFRWVRLLELDLSRNGYRRLLQLSIDELSCLLYVISTFVTIIFIPGIAGATGLFQWEKCNLAVVLTLIYSLVAFCLFPSCLPGRIARHFHSQQNMKRAALRYLSHEIRSPLNVVCNGIAFTIQDLAFSNLSPDITENLLDIQHASQAAVSLLNDLLDYEKIESGMFRVTTTVLSVSEIIATSLKPLGIIARQKGIDFSVVSTINDLDSKRYGVLVDKLKLEQVFLNIVVNAVKFTSSEGSVSISIGFDFKERLSTKYSRYSFIENINKKIKIKVIEEKSDDCSNNVSDQRNNLVASELVIDITDTGVGIPAHVHHLLFGEFFQFDADHLQGGGGSGLGLWICKEIIQRHGGSITYRPGPNSTGSVFSIRLQVYSAIDSMVFKEDEGRGRDRDRGRRQNNNNRNSKLTSSVKSLAYSNVQESLSPISAANLQYTILQSKKHILEEKSELQNEYKGFTSSKSIISIEALSVQPTSNFLEEINELSVVRLQYRILVVDDSDLNRKMLIKTIRRAVPVGNIIDVVIEEVNDGVPAVCAVHKSTHGKVSNYDMIFMDNVMIQMNGTIAVTKMRGFGYQGPVIGVTGNAMTHDVQEFIRCGADRVLVKPVDPVEVRSAMEAYLPALFPDK